MTNQVQANIKQLNNSVEIKDTRSNDYLGEIQQQRFATVTQTHKVQFTWNGMKTKWYKGSMDFINSLVNQMNTSSDQSRLACFTWK